MTPERNHPAFYLIAGEILFRLPPEVSTELTVKIIRKLEEHGFKIVKE